MNDDRPSSTAALMAACRGLTALLPEDACLIEDPFGVRFGGKPAQAVERAARRNPALVSKLLPLIPPLRDLMYWMQVRTRVLDDELLSFVRQGGTQVLLLGAGFDCRAARFPRELAHATVFEVDHPTTQAHKKAVLAGAPSAGPKVVYLAWNFERDPMSQMPARLAELGHDPHRPTLTIWEGVTMYLTERAIEASVAAVRELSAPGSRLAIMYYARAAVDRVAALRRFLERIDGRLELFFRFGWDPDELPGWLEARGFELESDRSAKELSRALLPERHARLFAKGVTRRIAVAQRPG